MRCTQVHYCVGYDPPHFSIDGFRIATEEQLLHSAKFAVADKNGVVRDYVSSLEDDAVGQVARTVKDLAEE